jgi:phage terminase small subunit
MPWLELADWPTVRAWCELEYLTGQVYAALRSLGPITSQGETRRLVDDYSKLRQTQIVLSRELGMTPASRQALKSARTNDAFDLAAIAGGGHRRRRGR